MTAVVDLKSELEVNGWTVENIDGNFVATRGDVSIEGHQFFVEVNAPNLSTMKLADKWMTTVERFNFLRDAIRNYAEMADNGKLQEMARWQRIEKDIKSMTWQAALDNPWALTLIENALSGIREQAKPPEANQ